MLREIQLGGQVAQPHQAVASTGEGKVLIHSANPAVGNHMHQRDRFQSDACVDPLPRPLTEAVTRLPFCVAINRTPSRSDTTPRGIRHRSQNLPLVREVPRVEPLVATHRHWFGFPNVLRHGRRGHYQSVGLFYRRVPAVTRLPLLAFPVARHRHIGIGFRFARLIRPPLAAKVHRRIARIVSRKRRMAVLCLKTLQVTGGGADSVTDDVLVCEQFHDELQSARS